MIQIKEVESNSDLKSIVKFPFTLYKNSKYWVPPIINEEINTFKKNVNPALIDSDAYLF